MKRGLCVAALISLALVAGGGSGGAAVAFPVFRPCDGRTTVLCGTVVAPLDASGRHAGSVPLHVEELPAAASKLIAGAVAPHVLFMIAGGPGQASAGSFDLRRYARYWQTLFPGYTLVAFDDRGTGKSAPLRCSGLGSVVTATPEATARIVGACGRRLGGRSSLYSTRANADDMDAVRGALGADRIAIFGVSYGTEQALAYARAFPSHVERLVLDSVVGPDWPDPYFASTLQALPHSFDEICRHQACRGLTNNPGADFAKLANRLEADPVEAKVTRPGRRPTTVRLDGYALISLGAGADLDPGLAIELPAAVSSGLAGDLRPLDRLAAIDSADTGAAYGINIAVNVATSCADVHVPWSQETPLASRPDLADKAIAGLPAASTGMFGRWAVLFGVVEGCQQWPASPVSQTLPSGPLPNVPVLILSGSRDVRTPTSGARKVAAQFPRSRVLVVPGSGHSVTTSSSCASGFVAAWLEGRAHARCPRVELPMAPLKAFPPPAAADAPKLTVAQTLTAVANTLREGEATALAAGGLETRLGGLAGGVLRLSSYGGARMTAYADVAGVAIDGYFSLHRDGWKGFVVVSGRRAASGELVEDDGRLTGSFDGRHVAVRSTVG